jgi:hypothetical protein
MTQTSTAKIEQIAPVHPVRSVREQLEANRRAVAAAESHHLDASLGGVVWDRTGPIGRLTSRRRPYPVA